MPAPTPVPTVLWQHVSRLNPILHIVNAFRYGLLGVSDINILNAILGLALGVTILFAIAMHLLKTGKRLRA